MLPNSPPFECDATIKQTTPRYRTKLDNLTRAYACFKATPIAVGGVSSSWTLVHHIRTCHYKYRTVEHEATQRRAGISASAGLCSRQRRKLWQTQGEEWPCCTCSCRLAEQHLSTPLLAIQVTLFYHQDTENLAKAESIMIEAEKVCGPTR